MWKIIQSNLETVRIKKERFTLWMKWQFTIEFANDSFWPYDYKFGREDCYYIDWLEDRWSVIFPLRNKEFNNTEIFLETDDIIVCSWERVNMSRVSKKFIDVINIKTEKKQRIITDEVNLICNAQKEIILNTLCDWIYKTLILNIETLEIQQEREERLLAFFKCVFHESENKWFLLDFIKTWIKDNEGHYTLKEISSVIWQPKTFNRKEFLVNSKINAWELSCN